MNDTRPEPPLDANETVTPKTVCAITPNRGDVTTVRAASDVKLQTDKRAEKLQSHAPSHRTAGTADLPSGPATDR